MGIWIVFACVCFSVQTLAMRYVKTTCLRHNLLITGSFTLLIALGFGASGRFTELSFTQDNLQFGLLFGLVFSATIICYYYAMHTGPLSYTSFFYSASMVIPSLVGILFWKEPTNWQLLVGIALFLGAFFFISVPGAPKGGKFSKKWVVFCFLSWLLNGCCSTLVSAHQRAAAGESSTGFMLAGYLSAAVVSFSVYGLLCLRTSPKGDGALLKTYAPPLLLVAAGNGLGNALVAFLASRVASAYLFPVVLGGMLLLVTLYSMLVFKEKINRWGKLGILVGLCAIVVMNL